MSATARFAPVKTAIDAGLAKLNKYYNIMEHTGVYFICLGRPRFYHVYINAY